MIPPSPGMDRFITTAYAATMCLLGVYGLHRLWLLWRFQWHGARSREQPLRGEPPVLTVQLPIYNERTVAARMVRAAGALEYPRGRLEIQVLDDSTDETRGIVEEEVERLRAEGVDARVVRRPDRRGYKAGALAHGLRAARGELVCIFDADFVPGPDFLLRTVGAFEDPRVGMVQARWDHANRDQSLLTRAQSALLDGHFVIEHQVRYDGGMFFNFNGTAGTWRRAAIESAGGWQHDTLTEDLDLSYRAQLGGWKFVYAWSVQAPAEVPPDIDAFKSQQHRWAKGSVQVFRKLAWRILRSDEPLRRKLEAMAHLSGNLGYPAVLAMALLLPLAAGMTQGVPSWVHGVLFVVCTLSVFAFYERSQAAVGRPLPSRLKDILAAVVLGIGLAVNQTRAVAEGWMPGTGAFVRTPKQGDAPASRRYRAVFGKVPGIELLVAAWLGWGILAAVDGERWGSVPFLVLFFASFAWVGSLSLRQRVRG